MSNLKKRLNKIASTDEQTEKQYVVIYNDNGMDVFKGSEEQCKEYIQNRVTNHKENEDEYSICLDD